MNFTQNEKEVWINQDPVVGVIILTHATLEETRSHMNMIIKMGNEDESVHTVFFDEENVGVVLIEPNSIFTGKNNRDTRMDMRAESMMYAINAQIETVHMVGSYMLIWTGVEPDCAYMPDETIGFDTIGGKTIPKTVRIFNRKGKKRQYLMELPLTDK